MRQPEPGATRALAVRCASFQRTEGSGDLVANPIGNTAPLEPVCGTVQIQSMVTPRILLVAGLCCLLGAGVAGPPTARAGQTRDGAGRPARDTSALDLTTALAALSGRVLKNDTGAAVKRAIVSLAGQGTRNRQTVQTDDNGRYQFSDLPAGRYTVTASKAGFISLAYGQKHPRQPALPIQLDTGRQFRNVDIALPRESVITGHVVDEDGEPMTRAMVQVLRYVYRQGLRQIEPAGTDQTDDRGQYRVFDLEPGDYFVSVTLPRQRGRSGGGGPGGLGARGGRGARLGGGRFGAPDLVEDPDAVGFAPSYYPGVTMLREAVPLTVGLSQETSGVNFAAQLVRMARVGGIIFGADGSPAPGTQVLLTSAEVMGRAPASTLTGRVDRDGSFELHSVPPGRYTVQALTGRGRRDRELVFASQEIAVDGQDITDLTLTLRRGAEIRGTLTFDGTQMPDPSDLERLLVTTSPLNPTPFDLRGRSNAGVEADGRFVLRDIGDGPRLIRLNRLPDELRLKAVYVEGRDIIDSPRQFTPGQTISGVTLVLTDQVTELAGMVHDEGGDAVTEFTIIAFPTDERLWQPQSRHIMASRPDQNAQYRMRGLPPGDYLLSVVEVVQPGEWFDPRLLDDLRQRAARVTLRDGEHTSLNLGLETPR